MDLLYGRRVVSIGWKKVGTELTIGLNHAIVHFDKRQKREAWTILLEPGMLNCSVDWNISDVLVGTGNNADHLRVYDVRMMEGEKPVYQLTTQAAIKALQWNPKNPELLAIGAGTADRHLYLIDLKEGKNICKELVGSQVCDLTWPDEEHLMIGTGYGSELSGSLSVWRHRKSTQSLKKIGVISGYKSNRVLNLAKEQRRDWKAVKICSHSCNDNQTQQTISIWKMEKLEEREKREKQRLSSMQLWEIR